MMFFRAERPQKGRFRQFSQCDIDIINEPSIKAEIEVLYVSAKTMLNLGFKNFVFKINDRRILNEIIIIAGFKIEDIDDICISIDKFDKGLTGVKKEMLDKNYKKKLIYFLSILEEIKQQGIETLDKFNINKEFVNDVKTIVNTLNELSKKRI